MNLRARLVAATSDTANPQDAPAAEAALAVFREWLGSDEVVRIISDHDVRYPDELAASLVAAAGRAALEEALTEVPDGAQP